MFSYETTVSYSRTDRNGKVPMHEILNLLQDCSTFHSEDIGHGVSYMKREARAWVLVAYKVIVNRPIMFGQKITIGTSPSKFSSMFASRQYFIKMKMEIILFRQTVSGFLLIFRHENL